MIRLEIFGSENYSDLISWVDSEELLMQFAGSLFTFPLTAEQLDISLSDKNRLAFRVVSNESNSSIGHSEIYMSEHSDKIGRILIANKEHRGKGLGEQVVNLLLEYIFLNSDKHMVELNVFKWNKSAIKCYEKAGFTINQGKELVRKVKDEVWVAINMTIDREKWNTLNKIVNS